MSWFLDGLAVFFLIILGVSGFARGLIEELGRLVGLIAALIASVSSSSELSQRLVKLAAMDRWVALCLAFAGIFAVVLIATRILTRFIHIAYLSKSNQWVNRSLGFVFGSIKGFFIIIAFTWILAIVPLQKWSHVIASNSRIVQTGTAFRVAVVSFFNWEDPVALGESYIMELTQP